MGPQLAPPRRRGDWNVGLANKGRILVVDDESDMAELIASTLVSEGYQPIMAVSMETALDHFNAGRFVLAILDIFMFGMGGIEGIRKIRDADPEIKVIAISGGYADLSPDQALAAARKIGVEAVLPKPFSTEHLCQTVRRIVGP